MALVLTLALVYGGGLVWNFVRSGGATWNFEWPVQVVVLGWNKLFGADSVFDNKEDENQ